jgi:fibronectin-binding autotransporter adhesin
MKCGGLSEIGTTWKTKLLAGVGLAALAIGLALPAQAADHQASNEAELRQAILDANADTDEVVTVTLTGNVTIEGLDLPAPTREMTISTGEFALTGGFVAPFTRSITMPNTNGATVTLDGSFVGGTSGPTISQTGGAGLVMGHPSV